MRAWFLASLTSQALLSLAYGIALLVSNPALRWALEAVAVGLSTVPPLSALVVWAHGLGPVPELNLTTTLFLPHVALDAYAFARSDMFEFHPATRRAGERAAIDDLGTPVVIVDEQGRVVTLNAAAESAFGVGKAAALTRPLAALLDEDNLAIATTADGDAVDTDGVASGDGGVVPGAGTDTVTIKREAGQSVYAVTPTPLSGAGSVHVGYTVVFQNVTAERRREQRLNVLNRVLRHNLRNDMTVVTGFTQAAAERVDDPETASMLDRATDAADDLVELGQKAREVERLLDRENHAERVVLADTVERVVADHMDTNPSATVTVAAGDVAARTDPTVLETVVGEPVENALVHAGPEPTVELVVQRRADAVAVTVTDDGPGIPEHERAAIDAGVESALEHGSGLGLWLANWGATSLGGRLVLDSNGGTTATVELPGSGESDRE